MHFPSNTIYNIIMYMFLKMKREMHILLSLLLVCARGLELLESAPTVNTNSNHTIMKVGVITKPGCPSNCGNLIVPFPFGIKSDGLNCSINPSFDIICDSTTNPPKALMPISIGEVIDISDNELRISNFVSDRCYDPPGSINEISTFRNLRYTPYMFSESNVVTVVGCAQVAYVYKNDDYNSPKGCITSCSEAAEVEEPDCSGTGCCQVPIKALKYVQISVRFLENHTDVSSFNPCGYAFFGEKSSFKFRGASDLNDTTFVNRIETSVPTVFDWVIDENKTCAKAVQDSNSYACVSANSFCVDIIRSGGYRCSCEKGYEGNPYLKSGCQDINECEDPIKNDCKYNICKNTPGSYTCSCPHGYKGDGRICRKSKYLVILVTAISSSLGVVLLLVAIWFLYNAIQRRKIRKLKEKFFEKNGGLLLQQQFSSQEGAFETNKLFSSEELEKATSGYNDNRILGQGGQGTVYKGMMTDGRIVAVKKSKIEDATKLDQFINEVVILSQINHRNIVKLHGCCLETEVPLLVYEFIPNGTLFQYIHDHIEDFPLSWDVRVRIAAEVAGALFYLHSAASTPIYHRDVKSTNILLDHKYSAKVADFGTSKSIAIDQTHMTTRVQGTFGYLDPEYFQSSQYTDKSDVYSFGVVLVELLTGQKPILLPSSNYEGRSLATLFMLAIKEDRLFDILDAQIIKDDAREDIIAFANLAYRCLNLNGKKRPTMKEVSAELERIRKIGTPAVEQQYDEVDNVQADSSGPWDYPSTSLSSSSIMNSLSVEVEPLMFSK